MKKKNGFTLVELLVGAGVAGLVGLTGFSVLQMSKGISQKSSSFQGLNDVKALLQEGFQSDRSMRNSITRDASMTCLDTDTTNCGATTRGFSLYNSHRDPAQAIVVQEVRQDPGAGLTLEGRPCDTFPIGVTPYNPNIHRGCVVRYVTTWTPICGADITRCRMPSYRLSARLESAIGPVAENLTAKINLSLFNVEIVRDARGETAQAICNSLAENVAGAGWDPATRTCVLGLNQSCPAGQLFVGMTSANQKICRVLTAMSCPRGSVIRSVATDGSVTCSRGCYLNIPDCTFNPWTGANSCPTDVGWVPGRGIMGTNPYLSPFAYYTPPPPPPSSDGDGDTGAF